MTKIPDKKQRKWVVVVGGRHSFWLTVTVDHGKLKAFITLTPRIPGQNEVHGHDSNLSNNVGVLHMSLLGGCFLWVA